MHRFHTPILWRVKKKQRKLSFPFFFVGALWVFFLVWLTLNVSKRDCGGTTGTVGGVSGTFKQLKSNHGLFVTRTQTKHRWLLFFENGLQLTKLLFIKSNLDLCKSHRETNPRQSSEGWGERLKSQGRFISSSTLWLGAESNVLGRWGRRKEKDDKRLTTNGS